MSDDQNGKKNEVTAISSSDIIELQPRGASSSNMSCEAPELDNVGSLPTIKGCNCEEKMCKCSTRSLSTTVKIQYSFKEGENHEHACNAIRREENFHIEIPDTALTDGTNNTWFPFPKKGQNVCLPSCCLRLDEDGLDDPFRYHCSHPWWMCYICFGTDYDKLVDFDKKGYLEAMCETNKGWKYPPPGRERDYDVNVDVERYPDFKKYGHSKITLNTLFDFVAPTSFLKWLWSFKYQEPYICVLAIIMVLFPFLWLTIVFGLADMSKPSCTDFQATLVWLFFTNPMSEMTITFCHMILLFHCIDPGLPWRPFKFYFPCMLIVYFAEILVFLPVALTVRTFQFQAILAFFVRFLIEMCCLHFQKCQLADFRADRTGYNKCETAKKLKHFQYFLVVELFLVLIYCGYAVGIRDLSGPGQTGLNIGMSLVTIFARVACQRLTSVFHKDLNFITTFITIYGLKASFTAFSSPRFGNSFGAYLSASITPLMSVMWMFVHMSDLWFRFRCYIKKAHFLFAKKMPLTAFAVQEDMDFQGRGSFNDQPVYMRTKIHNDIIEVYAQLVGNALYLCISPILRYGPNKYHFPYSDNNHYVKTVNTEGETFSENDYLISMLFAVLNMAYLLVGLLLFTIYLRLYYPKTNTILLEFSSVFWRYKWKLGSILMCITAVNIPVLVIMVSFGRVWWYEFNCI